MRLRVFKMRHVVTPIVNPHTNLRKMKSKMWCLLSCLGILAAGSSPSAAAVRLGPVCAEDSPCSLQQPGLLKDATARVITSSLFKDGELIEFQENLKRYTVRGGFYKVVEECAERNGTETAAYLKEICRRATEFIESNELEDRGKLVDLIKTACNTKGISMLLGGKNTGKSFILKSVTAELSKDSTNFVVQADLRQYASLFEALKDSLAQKLAIANTKRPELTESLKDTSDEAWSYGMKAAVRQAINIVESRLNWNSLSLPFVTETAVNVTDIVIRSIFDEPDMGTVNHAARLV